MKSFRRMLGLILVFVAFTGVPTLNAAETTPFRFSMIPKKDIEQQIQEFQPLIQLLEHRLQRPVEVVRASSYQAVIEGVLSQTIDMAILGPAAYAFAKKRDPEIEPFASFSQQAGVFTPKGSYYRSLLVTRKDSRLTLADLRGKRVALTDPKSTSGSVIPKTAFAKVIGQETHRFFAREVYTGSHDRSILSLVREQTDAAFVSSARLDEAVRRGVLQAKQIDVLWRSEPIHYDPFVFRSGLDPSVKHSIRQLIFSASEERSKLLQLKGAVDIEKVTDQDYQNIVELTDDDQ